MNQESIDSFRLLFEGYVDDPGSIDEDLGIRIDAMLDDIEQASSDHGSFVDSGGSHSSWLMHTFYKAFGDEVPDELGVFGSAMSSVAATLTELSGACVSEMLSPDVHTQASAGLDETHVSLDAQASTSVEWRPLKRAAAASLKVVSRGKIPVEACVGIADLGVETVRGCIDLATGKTTPLDAYSRLTDRAVAITGALARQATRIGTQAAAGAIGAYVANPMAGRAVGVVVGEALSEHVGKAAERGARIISRAIPSAVRKARSAAKSVFTRLKRFVWT